jgi:hypothetical protein
MAIKIIKKYTYEGNDYYLKSLVTSKYIQLNDEAGGDDNKMMFLMWKNMLCDSNGKLKDLDEEEIDNTYPADMKRDICYSIMELATGKKKA